ncbi:two-component system response regulator LytT [Pedobacter sp. UYP24]
MILNAIAVDDEPLALDHLSRFIEQTPFLNLAGRFANPLDALKAVHTMKVDVIFLDIQMPDLNGIELASVLNSANGKPLIIFTTAYHEFALDGYKVDALDYLLKPFNYQEFLRASQKALNYAKQINSNSQQSVGMLDPEEADDKYLFVKVEYQLVRLAFEDILFIEGLKDYVKIELVNSDKAILSRTSMKALEEKLPQKQFLRVHRSFIISLDKVTSMTKSSVKIGKTLIAVGDQYRDGFASYFRKWS